MIETRLIATRARGDVLQHTIDVWYGDRHAGCVRFLSLVEWKKRARELGADLGVRVEWVKRASSAVQYGPPPVVALRK